MSIKVDYGAATHVGCVRSVNQDAVLADPPVFLVADGMGGHAAGEVASALTVDAFRAFVGASAIAPLSVVAAVREANGVVHHRAVAVEGERGMGTTVAGIVLGSDSGEDVLVAFNVGDSRVYRYREVMEQVTADHSLVAERVAAGELTPEAAVGHPERNVVTRAVGVDSLVEVDLWPLPPVVGDRFLICTDGLTNEVSLEMILDLLTRPDRDPQERADDLVLAAVGAGARDNVSAVVVEVREVRPSALVDLDDTASRGLTMDEDTNPPAHVVTTEEA